MERKSKNILIGRPDKLLSTVLWLIAAHSVVIGLLLITQPAVLMKLAGFNSGCERFFPAQGGVFHLLMAIAYVMGAANIRKYHYLIVFSIIVKAVATVFLLVYYFKVEPKWVILLSGITDAAMGLMIFATLQYYLYYQKYQTNKQKK